MAFGDVLLQDTGCLDSRGVFCEKVCEAKSVEETEAPVVYLIRVEQPGHDTSGSGICGIRPDRNHGAVHASHDTANQVRDHGKDSNGICDTVCALPWHEAARRPDAVPSIGTLVSLIC